MVGKSTAGACSAEALCLNLPSSSGAGFTCFNLSVRSRSVSMLALRGAIRMRQISRGARKTCICHDRTPTKGPGTCVHTAAHVVKLYFGARRAVHWPNSCLLSVISSLVPHATRTRNRHSDHSCIPDTSAGICVHTTPHATDSCLGTRRALYGPKLLCA